MSVTAEAPAVAAAPRQGAANPALPAYLAFPGGNLGVRISEFNRFPTRYAHPSWWPAGWGWDWKGKFPETSRAETRLGESLLRHWDFPAAPCFSFDPPARRLALLDPVPLNRLVLLAGLARHADEISRILVRNDVKELRRQVGEDAYKFVIFKAPLLTGPLGAGDGAPPVPDWTARALFSGLSMLTTVLGQDALDIRGRVGLKFSRAVIGAWDGRRCPEPVESIFRLFRKVLLQEVDPAWDAIFS